MGTTAAGIRYPEPADPVNQGAAAMKNIADDVGGHAGKILGSAPSFTGATLPAGGGTLGLCSALVVAAVPYPRLIMVTLYVTTSTQTTYATYSVRAAGTGIGSGRGATAQQATTVTVWDAVPANTARSYDATVTSGAAVAVYGAPTSYLQAVAFQAAA